MLVVKVWCLPAEEEAKLEDKLRELHKAIVKALMTVHYLGVKSEDDLIVLFPPDMMVYGLGMEIFIEVQFTEPASDDRLMFNSVAAKLGTTFMKLYPNSKIQVLVHPFDRPRRSSWRSPG